MHGLKQNSGSLIFSLNTVLEDWGFSNRWALFLSVFFTISSIILISWIAYWICKLYLNRVFSSLVARVNSVLAILFKRSQVIRRLSFMAPMMVIYSLIDIVQIDELHFTIPLVALTKKSLYILMIVILAYTIRSALSVGERFYETFEVAKKRPIKVYMQILVATTFCVAFILVLAEILNISPWGFFTGLGAATALLALVFKDSILGFVASVQISAFDMVRIGDWITMPDFKADGQVKEISLTIVKVKNFDNSQTTIPTQAFLSHGVQNWRAMQESGGRRIKRALQLDARTIKFCSSELLESLAHSDLDIDKTLLSNSSQRQTNIGLFRIYVLEYLRKRKDIHQKGYDLVVRSLPPSEIGLPVEIYAFTKEISFLQFECIQADIFDHIIASLHLFELSIYQR